MSKVEVTWKADGYQVTRSFPEYCQYQEISGIQGLPAAIAKAQRLGAEYIDEIQIKKFQSDLDATAWTVASSIHWSMSWMGNRAMDKAQDLARLPFAIDLLHRWEVESQQEDDTRRRQKFTATLGVWKLVSVKERGSRVFTSFQCPEVGSRSYRLLEATVRDDNFGPLACWAKESMAFQDLLALNSRGYNGLVCLKGLAGVSKDESMWCPGGDREDDVPAGTVLVDWFIPQSVCRLGESEVSIKASKNRCTE